MMMVKKDHIKIKRKVRRLKKERRRRRRRVIQNIFMMKKRGGIMNSLLKEHKLNSK